MSLKFGRKYELTIYPTQYQQVSVPGNTFVDQLKTQVSSLSTLLNKIQSVSGLNVSTLNSILSDIKIATGQVSSLINSLQGILNIPSSVINGIESQITQGVTNLISSIESSTVIPIPFLNSFKNNALNQINTLTQFLPIIPAPKISFNTFDSGNNNAPIIIQNPFTIMFSIDRANMSVAEKATFRIYNLGQSTRNQIYKDEWTSLQSKRMVLKAGYASQPTLTTIFDGLIETCHSVRKQGETNYITEIEADNYASVLLNSTTTQSLSGKVFKSQLINQLVNDIIGAGPAGYLTTGAIHKYNDILYNVNVSENSWNRLRNETDNSCFIDNGIIHVLANNEYLQGSLSEINSATGMLGSPKRFEDQVIVEMLFEPSLIIGQKVTLNSSSNQIFNGDYTITGINHYGTISDAVNGKCQTTVKLYSIAKNSQLANIPASTK